LSVVVVAVVWVMVEAVVVAAVVSVPLLVYL